MTRTTNARVAGVTFLVYIAAGIASLVLAGNASATAVLALVTSFSALVLGVTLYAITREQDPDLAMLGLTCRVIEAVPGHGEIFFAVGSALFSWLLLRGRMIPVGLAWLGVIASALLVMLLPLQIAGFFGGPGAWSSPVTWAVWSPLGVRTSLAVWLINKGVAGWRRGNRCGHEADRRDRELLVANRLSTMPPIATVLPSRHRRGQRFRANLDLGSATASMNTTLPNSVSFAIEIADRTFIFAVDRNDGTHVEHPVAVLMCRSNLTQLPRRPPRDVERETSR
jgi:hypothetical protein